MTRIRPLFAFVALALTTRSLAAQTAAPPAIGPVTAIKAGRLIDPETGMVATNQIILVQNGRFTGVGANIAIPKDAQVIDLSALTVLPGLYWPVHESLKSVFMLPRNADALWAIRSTSFVTIVLVTSAFAMINFLCVLAHSAT